MTTGTKPGWYPGRCKDCAQRALPGAARCDACRVAHNAQETARRKARRKAGECVVCGARAASVDGQRLTVCPRHRKYYQERNQA